MELAKNGAKRERVKTRLLLSRENLVQQHGGIGVWRRLGVRGRYKNRGRRGGVVRPKGGGMAGSGKLFDVARMKNSGVIKDRGPTNAPGRESVGIGRKRDSGDLRFFEAGGKKRMRGLEMKTSRGRIRAGSRDFVGCSVEGDGAAAAEELNTTAAKRVGVSGNQFPVMFLAAEAKNGHARNTHQPAKLWVCWPC